MNIEASAHPVNSDDDAQKRDRQRTEELAKLQYWLANEDVYTSDYVLKWLERTPAATAAETLASIARWAGPESRSPVLMMFHGLAALLTTAEVLSENSPAGRKAGIRAALLLAQRKDPRALGPLARVFEPHWFWQGKYQSAIESALLHLLTTAPEVLDWAPYQADLYGVAEQIRQIGNGRQEITARQADLWIAILERMVSLPGETEILLLKTVALAEARTPHRLRAKQAAQTLLKNYG